MKLRAIIIVAVIIGVVALLMTGISIKRLYYSAIPLTPYERRSVFGDFEDRTVIKIGIPGPIDDIRETNLFLEGVQMAADELNNSGMLPLPIELVFSDDGNRMADVLSIAGMYSKDTDIAAVVGHWGSEYSISAAQVYENAGIIMLTPVSTNPDLTRKNFRLVFRNVPNDQEIGAFLAEYTLKNGYKNLVMLYTKDMTGAYVSNAYEKRAFELGLNILDRRIIDLGIIQKNYGLWSDADAVFIADIITRNKDVQDALISWSIPILATDAYDYDMPLTELSNLADSIHVITFFNPENNSGSYKMFRGKFIKLYDKEPDYWAIQGYDSIYILAEAIMSAGTLIPDDIASAMKNGQFERVSGIVRFDEKGDVITADIQVKQLVNGSLSYFRGGERRE